MRQQQLSLEVPMQRDMRLLPIEIIAVLRSEREAMRLCFDEYNRTHVDILQDWQWAALLEITKGQFSEYMNEGGDRRKHPPEKLRNMIERLTGVKAISQYHAYRDGFKLTQIDDSDHMRLKDMENQRLRDEVERLRKSQSADF
jgi:hypothetical protein